MILCKQFTFDSAHRVAHTDEEHIHGHTYTLQVCLNGPVQENGIIFDLRELKKIVTEKVLEVLDHKNLNETISQPTVENIAIWVWNQLKEILPLAEIKLWETATIFVSYSGE